MTTINKTIPTSTWEPAKNKRPRPFFSHEQACVPAVDRLAFDREQVKHFAELDEGHLDHFEHLYGQPFVTIADTTGVIMPAGTYYLGDPCYSFRNDAPEPDPWRTWLDACRESTPQGMGRRPGYYERLATIMIATMFNRPVLGLSTAFGDAGGMLVLPDGAEHDLGVDSGMIGLVDERLIEEHPECFAEPVDAVKVTFEKAFCCWRSGVDGGLLHFGGLVVPTGEDGYIEDDLVPVPMPSPTSLRRSSVQIRTIAAALSELIAKKINDGADHLTLSVQETNELGITALGWDWDQIRFGLEEAGYRVDTHRSDASPFDVEWVRIGWDQPADTSTI